MICETTAREVTNYLMYPNFRVATLEDMQTAGCSDNQILSAGFTLSEPIDVEIASDNETKPSVQEVAETLNLDTMTKTELLEILLKLDPLSEMTSQSSKATIISTLQGYPEADLQLAMVI